MRLKRKQWNLILKVNFAYTKLSSVWTLVILKHAYSIALFKKFAKRLIYSGIYFKRTQVSVTSPQIAKPCYSSWVDFMAIPLLLSKTHFNIGMQQWCTTVQHKVYSTWVARLYILLLSLYKYRSWSPAGEFAWKISSWKHNQAQIPQMPIYWTTTCW